MARHVDYVTIWCVLSSSSSSSSSYFILQRVVIWLVDARGRGRWSAAEGHVTPSTIGVISLQFVDVVHVYNYRIYAKEDKRENYL